MTPERPPERRHRQPGRRASDAEDFAKAVFAQSNGDQIVPESWTVTRVTKWLTMVSLMITVVGGGAMYLITKIATRQEVELLRTDIRALQARQAGTDSLRLLLIPMARLQCLQMEQWKSTTMAIAAGLPCDVLLFRRQP